MFTSAGYGVSLSPGIPKRKQNPSLLVGNTEQAYRAKQICQPIASDPRLLQLCYSQVKKCVCLGKSESTDRHFRCLCNERLWRCDEEVVSRAEATKGVGGWLYPYLFGTTARWQSSLTWFLDRISLFLVWSCLFPAWLFTKAAWAFWLKG